MLCSAARCSAHGLFRIPAAVSFSKRAASIFFAPHASSPIQCPLRTHFSSSSDSVAYSSSRSPTPLLVENEEDNERWSSAYDGDRCVDNSSHTPVLLSEVLNVFQGARLHTFVDCTLGAAGHASAIIKEHHEMKNFVGLDVDSKAHSLASFKVEEAVKARRKYCSVDIDLKINLVKTNFRNLKSVLHELGLAECGIDGILMDLGMSSMQLDAAERGFSLQQDGPLDMRMNPSSTLTAGDILNSWPETEIGRIIRDYGEERQYKRLARRICEVQLSGGIHSTSHLLQLIQDCLPSRFSAGRTGWKKTAIRVFQALRIAVNDELSVLQESLPDAFECLGPKGRLAVISFHSLEDRIVKQYFLKAIGETIHQKSHRRGLRATSGLEQNEGACLHIDGNKILEGKDAILITRKPVTPGLDEIKQNARSRSAKLRVLEKK